MEVQILRICFDLKEWWRVQRLSFPIIKEIRQDFQSETSLLGYMNSSSQLF